MGEQISGIEKDTLSRNRIVSEINQNFFVEAGAGSGKTTMLVNRMVAMVESGIDIRKICAITFTRAAAGEFYDRFQKLLIRRSSPVAQQETEERPGSLPPQTEETRRRSAEALKNIDLCFMGTIDSFCKMILSEHPSAAKIPPDAAIVSEEETQDIYRQQYVKISAGEYGEELRSLAGKFQSVNGDPLTVFLKGISKIMDNRNARFHFDDAAEIDVDAVFENERNAVIRAARCLAGHPELAYTGNKESREAWAEIAETGFTVQRRWSSNFGSVMHALRTLAKIRLIPAASRHYAGDLGSLYVPGGRSGQWLQASFGGKGSLLERLGKYQYDVSMAFLTRCIPVLETAMRERGSMTYFDCLYCLRNVLRRDAEEGGTLIRHIYDRHSHFLIDEFQDTNPLQAEVFFYLSSEKPVPQWSACVPRKGSLFIVGDPKQSIYRFRSADVTSFLKVKKLFEENGGEILSLTRNFRSKRELCMYFNRVFTSLLPEETESQSRFEEIPVPGETKDEFRGIFTYRAHIGNTAQEEHREIRDPVRIADVIQHLAGREDIRIRDGKKEKLRAIRYSDFMVITKKKALLGPITAELKKREIPIRVEGDIPFAENEALREIGLIYSSTADAEDTSALWGALTGKLIGFSREDLLLYKTRGGILSLKPETEPEDMENTGKSRVGAEISRLKELCRSASRLSPAALFSKIMDDYHVYRRVSSENMEIVCYAWELLRNAEKTGEVVTLKDGVAFLNTLIEGGSGEERCLNLDMEKDCVHLANLHKVKGLEAPIVILAGAIEPYRFDAEYRLEHGDDGSDGYLFSVGEMIGNRWVTYIATSDYEEKKEAEEEVRKEEECRLIYVAATRAKNALILCNSVKTNNRGRDVPDSAWTRILERGLPDLFQNIPERAEKKEEDKVFADAAELYRRAEEESILNNRSCEEHSFRTMRPSSLRVRSKIADTSEEPEAEDLWDAEPEEIPDSGPEEAPGSEPEDLRDSGPENEISKEAWFPDLLGTMAHRLMEMLVTSRNRIDAEKAVDEIIREYRTPASVSCEDRFRDALLKAARTMRNGGYVQSNGAPQDMLGTLLSADEVYCEIPFCCLDESDNGKVVWNGIIDVVYLSAGKWHIVDYKTNADGSDLDIRYREQLNAYVNAFRLTMKQDADAMVYHIDL